MNSVTIFSKTKITASIRWIIILFGSINLYCQTDSTTLQADSTYMVADSLVVDTAYSFMDSHPPRKAVILSALLPGAGQFYNKKYWKIPLVYAGIGISIYYLDRNNTDIDFYRKHLRASIDDDPNTVNTSGIPQSELSSRLNDSKRLRDISYISIAGFYILQIIDANVDAHLWHFDVSDDLSFVASPTLLFDTHAQLGLALKLKF